MLVSTPWNVRSAAFASWQVSQAGTAEATAVCAATDITGVVVMWNPPVPKLVAEWQPLQATVPEDRLSGGMCVDAGVTMLTPVGSFQVSPIVWQLWHEIALSVVWPAAESTGVPLSTKPAPLLVIVSLAPLNAWHPLPLQPTLPIGMWLPAPGVPTVPGICHGCPLVPWPVPANTVEVS